MSYDNNENKPNEAITLVAPVACLYKWDLNACDTNLIRLNDITSQTGERVKEKRVKEERDLIKARFKIVADMFQKEREKLSKCVSVCARVFERLWQTVHIETIF